MPRYIFIAAVVGSIIFTFFAFWFVFINRTPKIFGPVIAAVAAVVTELVTSCFFLKASNITERFPISLILDVHTKLPILIDKKEKSIFPIGLGHLAFAQPNIKLSTDQEITDCYTELIQYELIKQCFQIFNFDYGIGARKTNARTVVQSYVFAPLRPKYSTKIPCSEVSKKLSGNRFVESYWKIYDPEICLPIPMGAKLSFSNSQSFQFERPGYYKIDISIKHISRGAGVPAHLSGKIQRTDVETITFLVNMEAKFDKFTAESPYTTDAYAWTKTLFARLKKELADP